MSSLKSRLALGSLVATLVLVCAFVGSLVGRELALNCELYGNVTYKGAPAAVGTRIEACVGSTRLADTTVRQPGLYEISIPPDDPVTVAVDGWVERDEITLYVNGRAAQPTVTAFGGRRDVDLSLQLISDVRKSTWGRIKALFR